MRLGRQATWGTSCAARLATTFPVPVPVPASRTTYKPLLQTYPARPTVQYLYMRHLRGCYLFRGCPQRVLDTLLASARVEVFMPGEGPWTVTDELSSTVPAVAALVSCKHRLAPTVSAGCL